MVVQESSTRPNTPLQFWDHAFEYMVRSEYPQQHENEAEEADLRTNILLDNDIENGKEPTKIYTSCNALTRRKRVSINPQIILSMVIVISTVGLSTALINPISSSRSSTTARLSYELIRNSISKNKILTTNTITDKNNVCVGTTMYARRKPTAPERVVPLKSKSKPTPSKQRRIVDGIPFPFGSTQSEAFLSTIAIAAEMDDTVASVYSPKTLSDNGMSYGVSRGRPKSVAGAMNKSTMRNNVEAEAAADELIASGMASPNSKDNLIELAQDRKRLADRKKYYEEIVETDNLDLSLYEQMKETETTTTQSKRVTRAPSSAPSLSKENDTEAQLISKQVKPKTSGPKKRRRGRPRKYPLPERDIESVVPVSSPSSQPLSSEVTNVSEAKKKQIAQLNGVKDRKSKRSKTKQVRKRDSNLKPGKHKGDKLNLQQYYNTELLTASEEYSLGMKVRFLMKCEEVYQGISNELVRTPTISEWAYACGFKEPDEMSEEGYVESRLESSIRPTSPDDDSSSSKNSDERIVGSRFVGNGLENETGVGRGRGRAKKPPAKELKNFYDDSLVKFSMEEDEIDPSFSKSFKVNSNGKTTLIPINRGTPKQFVEMILTSKEAKQRMVECNMRLVVSIARRYHNVGVNIQDLVQEGSLGLFRAAEKFDPSKGFKFSTYASWWIQQAVFRSIAYHSRTIRLPVHVHNLLNRARRVKTTLKQELGRNPTNEEMAEQLDMTQEKFAKILNLTKRTISLEKPKYTNNPKDLGHASDATLGDSIDSSSTIKDDSSPEEAVDQGLFQDDLKGMLQILGDDERRVICARYGLHDGLTRTVSAVAVQLRQSKSWVRSQECRALRKLRRPWYENRLREHQNSLNSR